jgi:protein-disulfide isomerase
MVEKKINVLPFVLIIVAVVMAVILVLGGDSSVGSNDDSEVEGSADEDFGDYADYITEGVSSSVDDDPYLGNKDTAKIAIVEFTDYQCYYCYRHTSETLPSIIENFVDTGEVIYVFRDYQIHGEEAEKRAEIGECVDEIGGTEAFVKYHEQLMSLYAEDLTDDEIYDIVDDLGVDSSSVKSCYKEGIYADEILADADDASSAGISGTPGFIVGILDSGGGVEGYYISGALPYDTFASVIEALQSKLE